MRAPVAVILGVMGLVLAAGMASADPKAVEKVVKSHLVELGKLSDDDKLSLAKDAIVINERGSQVDLSERDGCVSGAVANSFYGCVQADITHTPGKLTVGSDGTIAWFQGPFTVTMNGEDPDGNAIKSKETHRVAGVAIKDGKAWKIAAIIYVAPIPDKALFKSREQDIATTVKLDGDKKLGAAVSTWFQNGFAAAAAAKSPLIASGTAPAELKTAAAATKLVQTWDKLKIRASQIDSKLLAGGKVGWVTAETLLPKKNSKKAIPMKVAIIVVPDGDGWRWLSIAYQPPFEISG